MGRRGGLAGGLTTGVHEHVSHTRPSSLEYLVSSRGRGRGVDGFCRVLRVALAGRDVGLGRVDNPCSAGPSKLIGGCSFLCRKLIFGVIPVGRKIN